MSLLQLYIERAAECRREAEATNLVNVRDRCLASALAWEGMAQRARQAETYRENEERRKAEQANTTQSTFRYG